MTRTLIATPLLLALVLSSTTLAYAQNATVDLNATADSSVLDADTSVDASVDNSGSGSSSSGSGDSNQGSDDNRSGAGVSGSVSSGFSLTKGDETVQSSATSVVASGSVNTENDLEAFAASTIRSSNTIDGVEAGTDNLRVAFKEKAKFLWFIPFTMQSRLEVTADGDVRVVRPWYSFLASVEDKDASGDLEARVRAALEGEAGLSARTQARVIEALALHFDGASSASASLDADASANTSTSLPVDASVDDDGTADQGPGDN